MLSRHGQCVRACLQAEGFTGCINSSIKNTLSLAPGKALLETAGKARAAPSDSRAAPSLLADGFTWTSFIKKWTEKLQVCYFLNCTYSKKGIFFRHIPSLQNTASTPMKWICLLTRTIACKHTNQVSSVYMETANYIIYLFINTVLIYSTIELHTQDIDYLQSMKRRHSRCPLFLIWFGLLNKDTPRSTPASALPHCCQRQPKEALNHGIV